MPNIKSAKKRVRSNGRKEKVNTYVSSSMKTAIKKFEKDVKSGNVEAAKLVGKSIAEKAREAKIKTVVFDRGGYLYHGRVKALADAARENGLEF